MIKVLIDSLYLITQVQSSLKSKIVLIKEVSILGCFRVTKLRLNFTLVFSQIYFHLKLAQDCCLFENDQTLLLSKNIFKMRATWTVYRHIHCQ